MVEKIAKASKVPRGMKYHLDNGGTGDMKKPPSGRIM